MLEVPWVPPPHSGSRQSRNREAESFKQIFSRLTASYVGRRQGKPSEVAKFVKTRPALRARRLRPGSPQHRPRAARRKVNYSSVASSRRMEQPRPTTPVRHGSRAAVRHLRGQPEQLCCTWDAGLGCVGARVGWEWAGWAAVAPMRCHGKTKRPKTVGTPATATEGASGRARSVSDGPEAAAALASTAC